MTTNTTGPLVAADHPLVAPVLQYRAELEDVRIRAAVARAELSNAETRAAAVERILAEHMARLAEHPGAVSRLGVIDQESAA